MKIDDLFLFVATIAVIVVLTAAVFITVRLSGIYTQDKATKLANAYNKAADADFHALMQQDYVYGSNLSKVLQMATTFIEQLRVYDTEGHLIGYYKFANNDEDDEKELSTEYPDFGYFLSQAEVKYRVKVIGEEFGDYYIAVIELPKSGKLPTEYDDDLSDYHSWKE